MRTLFFLILLFTSFHTAVAATTITENLPPKAKITLTESAFLRFLGPTILEIMGMHVLSDESFRAWSI